MHDAGEPVTERGQVAGVDHVRRDHSTAGQGIEPSARPSGGGGPYQSIGMSGDFVPDGGILSSCRA